MISRKIHILLLFFKSKTHWSQNMKKYEFADIHLKNSLNNEIKIIYTGLIKFAIHCKNNSN